MNDPRVELRYRIEHDSSADYSEAEPVNIEQEDFSVRMEDGRVFFVMKKHRGTVDSALKVVESFIADWEGEQTLKVHPGAFKLIYEGAVTREPNTTSVKYEVPAGPICWRFSALVKQVAYPKLPDGRLKFSDRVQRMLKRYEDYHVGGVKLTNMAYYCLTEMRKLAGGEKGNDGHVKRKYVISQGAFGKFKRLLSAGGSSESRKAQDADNSDLTPDERHFLARIHRRRGLGECPEAARRCSFESGIMVL